MRLSSAPEQLSETATSPGSAANQPAEKDTKVHIPAFMPFFWLGLVAIVGSLLSDWLSFEWEHWLGAGALCLVLLLAIPRQKPLRKVPASMLMMVCCLTAMLYQLSLPGDGIADIRNSIGKGIVCFRGTLTSPPEPSGSSVRYVISAESIERGDGSSQKVSGKVMISLPLGFDFRYGDRLEVTGELMSPPPGSGGFWRDYLEHRGIYTYSQFGRVRLLEKGGGNPLFRFLFGLRERGAQVIDAIFPAPENALLRGILLGDESHISPTAREAYSITGTSHIIAISGFNMAVLAGIVAHVFTRRLGAQKGRWLTIIVLLLYTVLVGSDASVVRAAFMGAFTVFGASIARRGNSLNNLGISVLLMTLINPHIPWDVGFQLSAVATLGLALLVPPLRARLALWMNARFGEEFSARFSDWIGDYLVVTLVAQASVMPLLLYHFRQFSWVFLIANPLILPRDAPAALSLQTVFLGIPDCQPADSARPAAGHDFGIDSGYLRAHQPASGKSVRMGSLALCRLYQSDGLLACQPVSSNPANSKNGFCMGTAGLFAFWLSGVWDALAEMAGTSDKTSLCSAWACQFERCALGECVCASEWQAQPDSFWAIRHPHAACAGFRWAVFVSQRRIGAGDIERTD